MAGYSRAIRAGPHVHVAGTTATDAEGNVLAVGDAGEQMRIIIGRISRALDEAGSSLKEVVRTRTYITREQDADAVMSAHGEHFSDIRPAATLVVIKALVNPQMLVECEVEALVGGED